jgi:hypothetical protein
MAYQSMERAGATIGQQAIAAGAYPQNADRPRRELEGIIQDARELDAAAHVLASKLHDIRSRLMGEADPQTPGPNVKEAVTCELSDLRLTLSGLRAKLSDIGRYTESLERF